MRLLICTQKVDKNDPILGFFYQWIIEFSKHVEHVVVICLEEGEHSLPGNVRILSLGKEHGISRLKYLKNFFKYIWVQRNNYDSVFVHMNPEYVLLGGLFWKLMRKKCVLWYTHKHVDVKLRLAEMLATSIASASAESFRLRSKKIHILGHGIDLNLFNDRKFNIHKENGFFVMGTAGRISSTKQIHLIIEIAKKFSESRGKTVLLIAGTSVTTEEKKYEKEIRIAAEHKTQNLTIEFLGKILYENLPEFYSGLDVFINCSRTGSLDKAVLEAMAMNVPVVSSNEAFSSILPLGYYLNSTDPGRFADVIKKVVPGGIQSREYVEKHHNLAELIPKLIKLCNER